MTWQVTSKFGEWSRLKTHTTNRWITNNCLCITKEICPTSLPFLQIYHNGRFKYSFQQCGTIAEYSSGALIISITTSLYSEFHVAVAMYWECDILPSKVIYVLWCLNNLLNFRWTPNVKLHSNEVQSTSYSCVQRSRTCNRLLRHHGTQTTLLGKTSYSQ